MRTWAAALALVACAHQAQDWAPGGFEDPESAALVRDALEQPCSAECSDHQEACRRDARECASLALDVEQGRGIAHDERAARALLLHACAAGNGSACHRADARTRTDRARDPVKAREWLREGCRKGASADAATSCADLWRAEGASDDDRDLAVRRLRQLCSGPHEPACTTLCDATHEEPACSYARAPVPGVGR